MMLPLIGIVSEIRFQWGSHQRGLVEKLESYHENHGRVTALERADPDSVYLEAADFAEGDLEQQG